MKRLVSIVCATFITLCIMPIQSNAVEKTPTNSVLNIASPSDVTTLDSAIAGDQNSFDVLDDVMEGLYRLDSKNEVKPGLAASYKVSADLKTYTFSLRNSKWSDGTQVTAQDFVYAWRKVANPDTSTNSYYYQFMVYIKNGEKVINGKLPPEKLGVKALGNQTFEVQLEKPTPYFLSLLAFPTFYPQKEKFVRKKLKYYGTEASATLYNGPFTVKSWNHGKSIKLVKNSYYWDQKAGNIKEVNISIIPNENTMYSMYNTGKLDRITVDNSFYSTVKNRTDLKQHLHSANYFLKPNLKNNILKNNEIRKAIALTIDKSKLVEGTFNSPLNTFVPKGLVYNNGKDFSSENQSIQLNNTQKAKEYWNHAKSLLKQGTISLNLLVDNALVGERIKQQLESNLDGLVINVKTDSSFSQFLVKDYKKEYDILLSGWGADYVDSSTYLNLFKSNELFNTGGYSNKTYDHFMDLANKETNSNVRWNYLLNAEKQLLEDTAVIPVYQIGEGILQSPKLTGIYTEPFSWLTTLKWTVKSN